MADYLERVVLLNVEKGIPQNGNGLRVVEYLPAEVGDDGKEIGPAGNIISAKVHGNYYIKLCMKRFNGWISVKTPSIHPTWLTSPPCHCPMRTV